MVCLAAGKARAAAGRQSRLLHLSPVTALSVHLSSRRKSTFPAPPFTTMLPKITMPTPTSYPIKYPQYLSYNKPLPPPASSTSRLRSSKLNHLLTPHRSSSPPLRTSLSGVEKQIWREGGARGPRGPRWWRREGGWGSRRGVRLPERGRHGPLRRREWGWGWGPRVSGRQEEGARREQD